jgi:integrase
MKYDSQVTYLRIMKKCIKPKFGSYKLKAINPAILQGYANDLKLNGYSLSYIRIILTTFREALDYAVNPLNYISVNPMTAIKIPKVERKPRERIVLTMDQWHMIIDRFKSTRYYIPLMIGFYTGLRISEVFALTWDDIDLEKRMLTVNKRIYSRNYRTDARKNVEQKAEGAKTSSWYFSTTKTESSNRTIPFGDTLYNALKQEKMEQMKNELKYGERYMVHILKKEVDEKGNDLYRIVPAQKNEAGNSKRVHMVCVAEDGRYTSSRAYPYCNQVIRNELGIEFDFHTLRHTHATLLIESGANVKNVQKRLGHANIQTTLQTYVHDTAKMGEQSVELFEKATTTKTS